MRILWALLHRHASVPCACRLAMAARVCAETQAAAPSWGRPFITSPTVIVPRLLLLVCHMVFIPLLQFLFVALADALSLLAPHIRSQLRFDIATSAPLASNQGPRLSCGESGAYHPLVRPALRPGTPHDVWTSYA